MISSANLGFLFDDLDYEVALQLIRSCINHSSEKEKLPKGKKPVTPSRIFDVKDACVF